MVQRLVPNVMLTAARARPYQVSAAQPLCCGGARLPAAQLTCACVSACVPPSQASLPPSGMCKLVAPAPTTALDAYAEEDVAAAAPVAVATTRGEGEGWKERHDTLMLRIEELEKERMNRSAGTGWAMVRMKARTARTPAAESGKLTCCVVRDALPATPVPRHHSPGFESSVVRLGRRCRTCDR